MTTNHTKFSAASLASRIHRWIDRLLKHTHDHFFCYLPSPTGTVSAFLLDRLFSGIYMGTEQADAIKRLPDGAIVVYTTKHKSRFEFLFAHTRYRQRGLPVPCLLFDADIILWQPVVRVLRTCLAYLDVLIRERRINDPYRSDYYRRELLTSGCAILSLVEKKGFHRRFVKQEVDPLQYLIEMQQQTSRPILLIPQLVFYSKHPLPAVPSLIDAFFGSSQRPGALRKMVTLIRRPGTIFTELSQPLDLQQWLRRPSQAQVGVDMLALKLRRRLLFQHNRHRQSITGPIVKSNEELKEAILTTDRMRLFLKNHAESRGEPIQAIRRKAEGYLDEIAARYSAAAVRLMSVLVGWIINSMFDGAVVDKAGLAKVKAMSRRGPLILIPCHKSHIDYLILSYILYHNNMPCPHIAAGKNLSFWPLGPIFRSGGAFFLRRTFRGAVLYARIFSAYIHKLLEEGFNIELFIEGGRSRTGKLLMPKLGLISILLEAYRNRACEDMIFVPVYIGYDRIIEEQAYIHEVEGGKKEDETLGQVIRARRFLRRRYGKIYINFHDPISTRDLLAESPVSVDQMSPKAINALCRNLGWRIINAIDRQTVITPHALMAAAILNIARPRFTREALMDVANTYLMFATLQNAKLADTIVVNVEAAMHHAIDRYLARKLIEKAPGDKETADARADYTVNSAKRSLLEFYKNNCISYFVPAAFTAVSILQQDAFQFSATDLHDDYRTLQHLFKYEFAFDADRSTVQYVRKTVKSFIDDAMLMPHPTLPDSYQITASGYRKLKLFAAFLKPYVESYWVVLHHMRTDLKENGDIRDNLKKIQSMGLHMVKTKEIDLVESVSKINYANALTFFTANGVHSHADGERIAHFESILHNHLKRLRP